MDEEQRRRILAYRHFPLPQQRAEAEELLAVMHPDRKLGGVTFSECGMFEIFTAAHSFYEQARVREREVAACRKDYLQRLESMWNIPWHERGQRSIPELEYT